MLLPVVPVHTNRESVMDKDRVEGAAKEVKGSVKETVGEVTKDTEAQVGGASEKTEGKVQNTVGGLKEFLDNK
jgi:uncharacterized protein YjbJ (UPF0337 family)